MMPFVKMTSQFLKYVVLLFAMASFIYAAPKDDVVSVAVDELEGVLPIYLRGAKGVEVHLRDRSIIRWRTVTAENGNLRSIGRDANSVSIDKVAFLRIRHGSRSKTRRWLGGIAGLLVGSVVGGTVAIGVSDSYGKDGLATAILVGSPIAGAWIGQRLAKPNVSYTTLVISRGSP